MALRHLSQIELAARWNISHRTLERWRHTGEGPQFIKLGGRVIYRLEDVDAFEAEQIRLSTSQCGKITTECENQNLKPRLNASSDSGEVETV